MSKEQSNLLLLGIGGGGGRLAAAVRAQYTGEMRMLCMDTDALSNRDLQQGRDIPCILFGASLLSGNGTGGDPVKGREAFRGNEKKLLESHLSGVRTVVILTCLGGGTGGGATPDVIGILKERGIAVLCIATHPFSFEGQNRQEVANRMRSQIAAQKDSLVDVRLDDLFTETGQDSVTSASKEANRLLANGVTLLWRMLSRPGFICADPERLHDLVMHGNDARFGSESASGDNRAARLMELLKANRLLHGNEALRKSRALLVGILGGDDLRLTEIGGIMKTLRGGCHADCRIELVVFAFDGVARNSGGQDEPPALDIDSIKPRAAKRRRQQTGTDMPAGKRFLNVEPTVGENGENLDVPTFSRRDIRLDR